MLATPVLCGLLPSCPAELTHVLVSLHPAKQCPENAPSILRLRGFLVILCLNPEESNSMAGELSGLVNKVEPNREKILFSWQGLSQ